MHNFWIWTKYCMIQQATVAQEWLEMSGESPVFASGLQLWSSYSDSCLVEGVVFRQIWVPRPAGTPGQLFILLFEILNYLTDGWGLNVSVFHKPFILCLELSRCPRAVLKHIFLVGRKERGHFPPPIPLWPPCFRQWAQKGAGVGKMPPHLFPDDHTVSIMRQC